MQRQSSGCGSGIGSRAGADSGMYGLWSRGIRVLMVLLALLALAQAVPAAGFATIFDAARKGTAADMRSFLRPGLAVDADDGTGMTALMYAVWLNKDPEVARLILDAGARIEYSPGGGKGFSPAMLAAWNPNPEMIRLLAERGADFGKADEWGTTPLMLAARYNSNPLVVKAIYAKASGIDTRTRFGWTALMFAAESNPNRAIASTLLDAGADPWASDHQGRTALILAQSNPNPEIAGLIRVRAGSAPEKRSYAGGGGRSGFTPMAF